MRNFFPILNKSGIYGFIKNLESKLQDGGLATRVSPGLAQISILFFFLLKTDMKGRISKGCVSRAPSAFVREGGDAQELRPEGAEILHARTK